jgi:hypothetical protein
MEGVIMKQEEGHHCIDVCEVNKKVSYSAFSIFVLIVLTILGWAMVSTQSSLADVKQQAKDDRTEIKQDIKEIKAMILQHMLENKEKLK